MTSTGSQAKSLAIDSSLDLTGKRVLVTCCWLSGWGGGEINILQLVRQLKMHGAEVECFTYWFQGPMVEAFKQAGVNVVTDSFSHLDTEKTLRVTSIDIENYDYIWICQQVLPISIIRQIKGAKVLPRFIFLHMSALLGIPVEAPIVWNFEKSVYDKILSISEDTTQHIRRILGSDFSDMAYYRNPVPVEYSNIGARTGTLRNIAVISSHPPDELIAIEGRMVEEGISVEYIGSWNGNFTLVDEKVLDRYDLIIGIGKNVQYCLVSGVPVYLYDYFGGCGYLNSRNYKKARERNFSGRGFDRKDEPTIVGEILDGYEDALQFHAQKREEFTSEYRIDAVLARVFSGIPVGQKNNDIEFSDEYIRYLESMQIMLHDRYVAWGSGRVLENKIKDMQGTIVERERCIGEIKRSNSYRIGNLLMKPLSVVKGAIEGLSKDRGRD